MKSTIEEMEEAKKFKEYLSEFKEERRSTSNTDTGMTQRGYNKPQRKSGYSRYDMFLRKCENFDKNASSFNSTDLVFYLRKVAEEHGYKIYIANMAKEASLMKKLKSQYDSLEVCAMIEFLYESKQDYIDKDRITVGLLCSRWATTIHTDAMLWVDDKYVPRSNKRNKVKKSTLKGEWDYSDTKSTKIGEWE